MRPKREAIRSSGHTYFVGSQTANRRPFFRHERWAVLLQDVLQHYRGSSFQLHAYVIMPDHFHILISPQESLERAVQNIKGGFSFRAKKAFEWSRDIWQTGFSDHRIRDEEDWDGHIGYISQNPVDAGLCEQPKDYRYLATDLDPIPQQLRPLTVAKITAELKSRPLTQQFSDRIEQ